MEDNFSSILGKAYVHRCFQRFYGSGREIASFFFAMMLADVCALSSLMEAVPYSRGRHCFHLGNDIEVGQTQFEYKKNERIKEIRPYVH